MKEFTVEEIFETLDRIKTDREGGYPAVVDSESFPGYTIRASESENDGPELEIFTQAELDRWAKEAGELLRELIEGGDPENDEWDRADCILSAYPNRSEANG